MRIAVIGAGLMGAATALQLARDGHRVTLLDRRDEPGMETSYANGGLLHAGHSAPWNSPGIVYDLARWIGREDAPFLVRPSQLPRLAGWGARFLANSRPERFARHVRANAALARYSIEELHRLREAEGLEFGGRGGGILKIFREHAAMEKARRQADAAADRGVRCRLLNAAEVAEAEPALAEAARDLVGALHYLDDGCGDAHLFTQAAVARACEMQAEFRGGVDVVAIRRHGGRVAAVVTTDGELAVDACVLAAGSYSPGLARPLGLRLPIYPVKGYSVTIPLEGAGPAPRLPFIDDARKIVVAVLGDRLRMAGTAELAGFDTTVVRRRALGVRDQALASLPELARRLPRVEGELWAGLRPMTADGPPILGSTPVAGLYLATGTGHLGWTFAAGAGRAVADVIGGREPAIDMAPYDVRRYG